MPTTTTNLGLTKPTVGADADQWGTQLNASLDVLDRAVQYDAVTKTLAATDVTLSADEAAKAVINLTGTLTANVNVIVPATPVRVYLVNNGTTGAFTVTVKTAAGTGTVVTQGANTLLYSNGTNIVQGARSVNGSFSATGTVNAPSVNGATTLELQTGGTTKVTVDSAGNLGLGVVPSAWGTAYRSFDQRVYGAFYDNQGGQSGTACNTYFNGTNWIYRSGNPAFRYEHDLVSQSHRWLTAPSGTAGNPITFTQAMTLDASGNLVVGGTSANVGVWNKAITLNTGIGNVSYELTVAGSAKGFFAADANNVYLQSSGAIPLIFTTNGAERARITAGGNLLVGTTTDNGSRLAVVGVGPRKVRLENTADAIENSVDLEWYTAGTNNAAIRVVRDVAAGRLARMEFYAGAGNTERARITSGGFSKFSNTGAYNSSSGAFHESRSDQPAAVHVFSSTNTNAAVQGVLSSLPSGAAGNLFTGDITGVAVVYRVLANGNVQNTNNSYGAISDIKLKENVTDATPKLDQLNQLRVVNYNLKADESKLKQIGLIAQEVEAIFPGLVESTPDTVEVTKTRTVEVPAVLDEEGNEVTPATTTEETYTEREPNGEVTKAVKYSVLVPMLLKAVQELSAQNAALTERIAALESK